MIKIQALASGAAEILIYEPIGQDWFGNGLTARRFIDDLARMGDVKDIVVRINSPGGEVFDGFAIYNALKNHPAQIHVQIDGLAASIASIIAMAGDLVTMGDGAMMMIHNPWTIAMGDSEDMRKTADMLDKVTEGLLDAYESRTGINRDELKTMLANETWFTTQEAIDRGFADERSASPTEETSIDMKARFSKFAAEFQSKTGNVSPLRIAAMAIQSASADALQVEALMSKEAPASVQKTDTETAEAVLKAEAARRKAIRDTFGKFADQHRELMDTCLDDMTVSAEAASKQLLAKLGEGAAPLRSDISLGEDVREKFQTGAQNALLARMGAIKKEANNEFNGMSLVDLAAKSLAFAGVSTRGMTKDAIARKVLAYTHTSSDFPNLLSATAGKVLRGAYETAAISWNRWCAVGSVSDFKIHPRIQLGSFSSLATISEGGEYTYGTVNEQYENAQALTKGKAIAFTRQMLVNDDLGGFNRRAQLMGDAAARTVNEDVYASLTSASGLGPTSSDGGTLINATAVTTAGGHANYTSSGTALSVASLGVGRVSMATKKAGNLGTGATLNLRPTTLLVPVGKEDTARTLISSETDPASSNSRVPNIYRNSLEVIADPYLDGVYANAWYLMVASNSPAAPMEVVFLDGNQTPFIDDEVDFDSDALKFKVRLDYGVAIGDWRGIYRNLGA